MIQLDFLAYKVGISLKKYLLSKANSDWNVTTKRMPRKKKKMLKKVLNRITGIKSKKIYLHFAYRSERA
jgi:hypothetical protein